MWFSNIEQGLAQVKLTNIQKILYGDHNADTCNQKYLDAGKYHNYSSWIVFEQK